MFHAICSLTLAVPWRAGVLRYTWQPFHLSHICFQVVHIGSFSEMGIFVLDLDEKGVTSILPSKLGGGGVINFPLWIRLKRLHESNGGHLRTGRHPRKGLTSER